MINRYVVGEVGGKSDILITDDVSAGIELAPNIIARDLWLNSATPADLTRIADPVSADRMVHEPPAGGAIFRYVLFKPGSGSITADQMLDMHAKLDSAHVPETDELAVAKHPSMHRTNSLNYITLASGELWMLTEGKDALLKPGDMVIQNGGIHGWRHEGGEPALLVAILIDGKSG